MPKLTLTFDSISSFEIRLNDFLSSRGIAVDDVTDVAFAAKTALTDTDEEAAVTKTLGAGVAILESGTDVSLVVTLDYSDYGVNKLEAGKTYYIGVGFKTATHTRWLEASWAAGPPILHITQDFFRN